MKNLFVFLMTAFFLISFLNSASAQKRCKYIYEPWERGWQIFNAGFSANPDGDVMANFRFNHNLLGAGLRVERYALNSELGNNPFHQQMAGEIGIVPGGGLFIFGRLTLIQDDYEDPNVFLHRNAEYLGGGIEFFVPFDEFASMYMTGRAHYGFKVGADKLDSDALPFDDSVNGASFEMGLKLLTIAEEYGFYVFGNAMANNIRFIKDGPGTWRPQTDHSALTGGIKIMFAGKKIKKSRYGGHCPLYNPPH